MQTPPSKITNVTNTNVSSNVPIFFGLKNPGNFCYMNVIIQFLHGLKCVRDQLSKINFQNDMNFSMALKRLFSQMKSRKGDISVMEFKNTIVLTPLFKEFDNNHQQDAHHFMIKVLQSISYDILSSHNDLISLWFRSTLLSRVQCQTCDSSSTNLGDHSTSIEVEIVGDKLQECLANFFDYEELDSPWICGNCNKERSASKYFLLQERPILIIALKRFSDTYEKNTRNVRFPLENLRIPNMVNENYEASDGTIYKLFAVINHLGMSSDSGHYTLFMNVHDNWLKFDDENVVQIRKERVNSSNAYILVYVVNTKFKELAS
jgi:ubiquitin C-terminal hydrolase